MIETFQRIPDKATERAARAQYEFRRALGCGMDVTVDWEAEQEVTRDFFREDALRALEASGAVFLTDTERSVIRRSLAGSGQVAARSAREKLS